MITRGKGFNFSNYEDFKNVLSLLKNIKTFVDIGAHKGETIDLFTSKLNINKIYSFEPNEKLFQELKKNKK